MCLWQFLQENKIDDKIKIIDLSQDFRLNQKSEIVNRKFVYGLPELNKEQIKSAKNIANPGCFATAIQLGGPINYFTAEEAVAMDALNPASYSRAWELWKRKAMTSQQ